MTEEEAKTKWCPMVRAVAHFSENSAHREEWRVFNRNENSPAVAGTNCIGSGCMMWREVRVNSHQRDPDHPIDGVIGIMTTITGHCGLAGK